jgi:DNA-directed RNA polymerase specialized sigma subunit
MTKKYTSEIVGVIDTENWLKAMFNINKELDFERENIAQSIKRVEQLEKEKETLCNIILSITNPLYKQILHKRYVQGKKWEEISSELHYENQHIHRLHKQAIEVVHKIRTGQE